MNTAKKLDLLSIAKLYPIDLALDTNDTYHYIKGKVMQQDPNYKVSQAVLKLMNCQAQANLLAVYMSVQQGRYQGGDTISYPDGSRLLIDLESKNVIASAS